MSNKFDAEWDSYFINSRLEAIIYIGRWLINAL
jgi:hypothetical protein